MTIRSMVYVKVQKAAYTINQENCGSQKFLSQKFSTRIIFVTFIIKLN